MSVQDSVHGSRHIGILQKTGFDCLSGKQRRKFSLSQKVFSRAIIFRSSENQQSYLGERNKIKNKERKEKESRRREEKMKGEKGIHFMHLTQAKTFILYIGLPQSSCST